MEKETTEKRAERASGVRPAVEKMHGHPAVKSLRTSVRDNGA